MSMLFVPLVATEPLYPEVPERVEKRTVADLASQYTDIYNADMTSILGASTTVMAPYPTKPFSVSQLLMSSRDALAQARENVARVKASATRLQASVARLQASIEAARKTLANSHELHAKLNTPQSEG